MVKFIWLLIELMFFASTISLFFCRDWFESNLKFSVLMDIPYWNYWVAGCLFFFSVGFVFMRIDRKRKEKKSKFKSAREALYR